MSGALANLTELMLRRALELAERLERAGDTIQVCGRSTRFNALALCTRAHPAPSVSTSMGGVLTVMAKAGRRMEARAPRARSPSLSTPPTQTRCSVSCPHRGASPSDSQLGKGVAILTK